MPSSRSVWILLILMSSWSGLGLVSGARPTTQAPITALPRQFHEDHRLLPWCINGIDEPEFKKYPWNEFVPMIQRKYFQDKVEANEVRIEIIMMFKLFTTDWWLCSIFLFRDTNMTLACGQSKYLWREQPPGVEVICIKGVISIWKQLCERSLLKVSKTIKVSKLWRYNVLKNWSIFLDVNLKYNTTEIQGLLVQANFAPYGVGIPMGDFVHPKLFNCVDCEKPVGIPIACRRRTHMHIVVSMQVHFMSYHRFFNWLYYLFYCSIHL